MRSQNLSKISRLFSHVIYSNSQAIIWDECGLRDWMRSQNLSKIFRLFSHVIYSNSQAIILDECGLRDWMPEGAPTTMEYMHYCNNEINFPILKNIRYFAILKIFTIECCNNENI